eukprot:CAMPEP_0176206452 /NCGR_PEP_ID=MMETSP0121_2-20121125/12113_1 /TAXON_ID=160619 /ORGANISM="Kryptoperidinium foliaceum, Strain CCMP 1326" /LENGTH=174 /DNA_ID=CAMNT_0017545409 /DNA_START=75 /DNA_END=595 /DNA_ORIENTATION=+
MRQTGASAESPSPKPTSARRARGTSSHGGASPLGSLSAIDLGMGPCGLEAMQAAVPASQLRHRLRTASSLGMPVSAYPDLEHTPTSRDRLRTSSGHWMPGVWPMPTAPMSAVDAVAVAAFAAAVAAAGLAPWPLPPPGYHGQAGAPALASDGTPPRRIELASLLGAPAPRATSP